MGLVRKLLFVLQTDWYDMGMARDIVSILREIVVKKWNRDDIVKPIVAYLAANLHEGTMDSINEACRVTDTAFTS